MIVPNINKMQKKRFYLSQGVPGAQGEGEGGSAAGAAVQRERLGVSRAEEGHPLRPGLPPRRADQRGAEAGGGGLLQRRALPAGLHLHPGRRDQPARPQVMNDGLWMVFFGQFTKRDLYMRRLSRLVTIVCVPKLKAHVL